MPLSFRLAEILAKNHTTSRGLMADRECRRQRIGGEVMCEIW